jgi:hypothetical protein
VIRRNHTGHRVGESHQRAKLSDEQIKAMRADYEAGKGGYGTLAKRYECGASTARDICTYRTRWTA